MDHADIAIGTVVSGRYVIQSLLKSGGMGAVYLASHSATRRRVALKVMRRDIVANAELRQRFAQEAQVASIIRSRFIVDVTDAGIDETLGMPFLVMELLEGRELGEILAERGRLTRNEVITHLSQTARGLDRAHAKGIVHRDLKPENLYVTEDEEGGTQIKILDFGIAKILQGVNVQSTHAGGTPLYMAPEQMGKAKITAGVDIWALGLIAYTLLVGRPYWHADTIGELYGEILGGGYEPAVARAASFGVQLPSGFDEWFARCLARDPAARFPTAVAAITELRTVLLDGAEMPIAPLSAMESGPHSRVVIETQVADSNPRLIPLHDSRPTGPMGTVAMTDSNPRASYPSHPMARTLGMEESNPAATMMVAPQPVPLHRSDPLPPLPVHTTNSGAAQTASVTAVAPPSASRVPWLLGIGVGSALLGAVLLFVIPPSKAPPAVPAAKPKASHAAAPSASASVTTTEEPSPRRMIEATNPFVDAGAIAIQTHEVSRREYAIFRTEGSDGGLGDRPLRDWSDDATGEPALPVTWVTHEQATHFCQSIDARLPTSAEWLAVFGKAYPWGETWPATTQGIAVATSKLAPVGSSDVDVTPNGVKDLAGNVQEWTSTVEDGLAVVHGASAKTETADLPSAVRQVLHKPTATAAGAGAAAESIAGAFIGFRCARSK